jgi:hypothetical protein
MSWFGVVLVSAMLLLLLKLPLLHQFLCSLLYASCKQSFTRPAPP